MQLIPNFDCIFVWFAKRFGIKSRLQLVKHCSYLENSISAALISQRASARSEGPAHSTPPRKAKQIICNVRNVAKHLSDSQLPFAICPNFQMQPTNLSPGLWPCLMAMAIALTLYTGCTGQWPCPLSAPPRCEATAEYVAFNVAACNSPCFTMHSSHAHFHFPFSHAIVLARLLCKSYKKKGQNANIWLGGAALALKTAPGQRMVMQNSHRCQFM